jgi:nitrous oxidase accessory protein NosD
MRVLSLRMAVVLIALLYSPLIAADALQNRIDKAPTGGEVKITKGAYTEPLTINKPLKLVGEDRDGCVIDVVSDQPAIRLTHGKGDVLLENLSIRWKRETSNQPKEMQAAVVAKDGKVVLRNVRIIAPGDFARCPCGLAASGFGDITIDNCTFEGYEFTLQFDGGAKANINDSVVLNPGHCGITAGPESVVNVARTIVTGSRYHGLRCTGGQLNAENNVVIANKNRGFYLGNKSATGTIRNNVIQDNGTGISAFAETEAKVQNNFIAGSEFAGIDMRDSCRLNVKKNLLANNARAMVLFPETGKNRNSIGDNASADNKTDSEGFTPPPQLVKLEAKIPPGEFASEKGFGLADAAKIKPVWERWLALRKTARAE